MTLTPQDFVSKWKRAEARERQSVQEHFLDLCQLAGHPTPIEADPSGTRYAFEMGAAKTSGGQGWADVAKLGYFGWEYKGKLADLDKAYDQLLRYRDSLHNPPLLIVSDINQIIIRTNYTNLPTRTITLTLDDLLTAEGLKTLKALFFSPDDLKPRETVAGVTELAAKQFSALAGILRRYGENPQDVAHFLIRLLFCLFAEDIGLLPERLFPRLLEQTKRRSKDFMEVLRQLFRAMNTGGYFGADKILYFNGGLFDDDRVLELDGEAMEIIAQIDALDWSAIEPSIFGTLFERGLDPAKRSQLGAHYTSREDILLIVEPVLMGPLLKQWERLKAEVGRMKKGEEQKSEKERAKITKEIGAKLRGFADEIAAVRVLDPACGSGNFLYVALRRLLDLQKEVVNLSDELGAGRFFLSVSPTQLHGIETNEYAHELAQITIWIGYIQWLVDNGYGLPSEPILKTMNTILHQDAILSRPDRSPNALHPTDSSETQHNLTDQPIRQDLSGLAGSVTENESALPVDLGTVPGTPGVLDDQHRAPADEPTLSIDDQRRGAAGFDKLNQQLHPYTNAYEPGTTADNPTASTTDDQHDQGQSDPHRRGAAGFDKLNQQLRPYTNAYEPQWPAADVIIGNPPFLGDKKMRAELGDDYVEALRKLYGDRIPGQSDLVCYWFEKARSMIESGQVKRAGLLATQGIRGGANRTVLERIKETGDIFWAWSDREWVLNGATVHVSMVGFDNGEIKEYLLNNAPVLAINADLSSLADVTQAKQLTENENLVFIGTQKGGPFDLEITVARKMLKDTGNPNGKPNSDVIKPWVNGADITGISREMWIIDFGSSMSFEDAAQYSMPFEYLKTNVYPVRKDLRRENHKKYWWIHAESRPGMRKALNDLPRYICTPRVSKHRIFVWLNPNVVPDSAVVAIARSDDYFFGVLHSKVHELWARATGTQLREAESGFRYTPSSTFETFPFPWAPGKEPEGDARVQAIASAAKDLVEMRGRWLNPAPSQPPPNPKSGDLGEGQEQERLPKRTLTNLYNARPTWLDLAHKKLDAAVCAAYGWPNNLSDEAILEKLLALNLARAHPS